MPPKRPSAGHLHQGFLQPPAAIPGQGSPRHRRPARGAAADRPAGHGERRGPRQGHGCVQQHHRDRAQQLHHH